MHLDIAFRTDSSLTIGAGHTMRCLALANVLYELGHSCHFIIRKNPADMSTLIQEQGHKVHYLPEIVPALNNIDKDTTTLAHADWLSCSWQDDARECSEILLKVKPYWLVVDHYAIDSNWESELKNKCQHLMVIDDLADRDHDCSLLLDQTFGRKVEEYTGLVPEHCYILTGSKYALLRPEFKNYRDASLKRRRNNKTKKILISAGGVDKDNHTALIIDALNKWRSEDTYEICVILGDNAPWFESIRDKLQYSVFDYKLHSQVSEMAKLMSESDFAIGAAGSTSWERCCLGLPTLLLVAADNQKDIAENLKKAGAVLVINKEEIVESLLNNLKLISSSVGLLDEMSKAASDVADGLGVNRVLEIMLGDN